MPICCRWENLFNDEVLSMHKQNAVYATGQYSLMVIQKDSQDYLIDLKPGQVIYIACCAQMEENLSEGTV
jgi:hypothetical protein